MDQLMDMTPTSVMKNGVIVGAPRCGPKRFWTTTEIRTLKEVYPIDGLIACLERLPGRSGASIYQRAKIEGLKSPGGRQPRRRFKHDPHIDEAIRRGYLEAPEKGRDAIKALARRMGRPVDYVRRRASALGLIYPLPKLVRDWTTAEEEFVANIAHLGPVAIQRRMKAAGFDHRTLTAITIKLRRLGADTQDPYNYSANGLAKLMGVDNKTVTSWINKGWLKASRAGTARVEAQGGDAWKIHRSAVRTFIVNSAAQVDIRGVDKFWFIDLLAGSYQ